MLSEMDTSEDCSYASCKEEYLSIQETCLCLQSCTTLLSKRRSVHAVDVNASCENINSVISPTKEHYIFKRVTGAKYKLGKLFMSTSYSTIDRTLTVTISQYGNVQLTSTRYPKLCNDKLVLHLSLRRSKTLVCKQKIGITQNAALKVFKYNYVSCFRNINEIGLENSVLRIKMKCKRSVFLKSYTVAERDIELGDLHSDAESTLDILFF